MCEMTEVLEHADRYECVTCGHEWSREAAPEMPAGPRVVLIQDLKLGGSQVLDGADEEAVGAARGIEHAFAEAGGVELASVARGLEVLDEGDDIATAGKNLQFWQQGVVGKGEESVAGDAFFIGGPV